MKYISIEIMKDEREIEFLRDKKSFNYTYDAVTINSLKKYFKLKNSLYLIAKQNKEFVAFCSMDRGWWEDGYFFIREILVNPNFQRIGIGQDLMQRCINHAKEKKTIGIVAETAFANQPMQKLCEKFDFKKWDNPEWKEGITYKLIF